MIQTSKEQTNTYLSICIPTHNRSNFLPKAIESILSQEFVDFEIIICDNASADNTREVVNRYKDRRIRYVYYPELVSMYANHNRCVELANAEWLIFLHSDDQLTDLNFVVDTINQLENMTACYPWEEDSDDSLATYTKREFIEILHLLNGISPSGCIYKTQSIKQQGGFAEDNIIADWEILINLSRLGDVYSFTAQPFVNRTKHSGQAYLACIKDGSAHFGKLQCIRRLFSKVDIGEFNSLSSKISKSWNKNDISKLGFYLYTAGFKEYFKILKGMAKENKNWDYFSSSELYRLLAAILNEKLFFEFYRYFRQFR